VPKTKHVLVITLYCYRVHYLLKNWMVFLISMMQGVQEQWCHMFRDLTDERGPWSTATSRSGPLIRWKLDKTEDPWRRRLKLKRNYHFDNDLLHPISGAPSSPAVDLVNETGGTLMEGVRTFLLKGLRAVVDESPSDGQSLLFAS
jgi:hypothetical protein